jgi:hypothetical protein
MRTSKSLSPSRYLETVRWFIFPSCAERIELLRTNCLSKESRYRYPATFVGLLAGVALTSW